MNYYLGNFGVSSSLQPANFPKILNDAFEKLKASHKKLVSLDKSLASIFSQINKQVEKQTSLTLYADLSRSGVETFKKFENELNNFYNIYGALIDDHKRAMKSSRYNKGQKDKFNKILSESKKLEVSANKLNKSAQSNQYKIANASAIIQGRSITVGPVSPPSTIVRPTAPVQVQPPTVTNPPIVTNPSEIPESTNPSAIVESPATLLQSNQPEPKKTNLLGVGLTAGAVIAAYMAFNKE